MGTATPLLLEVGQQLGTYRIDALLGVGGMGAVYSARDAALRRSVAIKVVDRGDAAARRALLQEARIAASLSHPAICSVHEVGCVDDQPFIVMEHVGGLPLSARIPAGRGLPLETVLHYALQIADAVGHAHVHGVVHGDLKSANVMVDETGAVKILDFGLATWDAPLLDPNSETTRSETPTGAGTVPYMAPEVLCGRRAGPRSDVWALGVIFFEMLAGARPFAGATRYELAAAILDRPPAPFRAQTPAPLRRIIARCLEKVADERFASARPLAAALDDLPVLRG
jgi:eukaryotic-like serine/threonine-protein kinase